MIKREAPVGCAMTVWFIACWWNIFLVGLYGSQDALVIQCLIARRLTSTILPPDTLLRLVFNHSDCLNHCLYHAIPVFLNSPKLTTTPVMPRKELNDSQTKPVSCLIFQVVVLPGQTNLRFEEGCRLQIRARFFSFLFAKSNNYRDATRRDLPALWLYFL